MAVLTWDDVGTRRYQSGTRKGVLYVYDTASSSYKTGKAWNGLTGVTESPSGAETTDLYADDIKYASIRSTEDYSFTIEAYDYPDAFAECDGSAEVANGVHIGQQKRKMFGFSWVTQIGNDVDEEAGYTIHLVWGATASPSDKAYTSINDSPDAMTFSWECDTNPVPVTGFKPTAHMEIDSTKANPTDLVTLEKKLYGDAATEATLPMPDEIIEIMTTSDE